VLGIPSSTALKGRFLMRTPFLSIAVIAALTFFPAFAQTSADEASSPDEMATALMIKTWQPSPETLVVLLDMVDIPTIVEGQQELTRYGLGRISGNIRWGACRYFFGDSCFRTETVAYLVTQSSLRALTHNPSFLGNMSSAQRDLLVEQVVTMAGEDSLQTLLGDIELVYSMEFDASQALNYQRWRQNACNFALRPNDGGLGNWREVNATMTVVECVQDDFTQFMRETYCKPATSPDTCDLQNISWTYGFLQRRYIIGGSEFVQDWQDLLRLTAARVTVGADEAAAD
jgi:hypothetical protein